LRGAGGRGIETASIVSPSPGALLANRFRLVVRLAHGGMGELWIAEHLGLKAEVVVKFIAAGLSGRAGAAERFASEAAAAAKVNSAHVVKILDYGASADGAPFIVMEKLVGRDLAALLAERGPLSPALVATIVRQIAKALTAAHTAGIIHRDIKPANVFLCDTEGEPFVKLLDFGVAKRAEADLYPATTTGICVGTPGYMSPEQILASKTLDHRADLWSLGVLAFHGLTGRKPFDGETAGGVMLAIHTLALPKPSAYSPSLPSAVDAWFARACAREPEDRFATAMDLANALAEAMSLPVEASSPPLEPVAGERVSATLSAAVPVADKRTRGGARRLWSTRVAAGAVAIALGGAAAYAGTVERAPHAAQPVAPIEIPRDTRAPALSPPRLANAFPEVEPAPVHPPNPEMPEVRSEPSVAALPLRPPIGSSKRPAPSAPARIPPAPRQEPSTEAPVTPVSPPAERTAAEAPPDTGPLPLFAMPDDRH
jgi:hypothetical protein